jgi:hypothetical protein
MEPRALIRNWNAGWFGMPTPGRQIATLIGAG